MVDWSISIDSDVVAGQTDYTCPAYITLIPSTAANPGQVAPQELQLMTPDGVSPLVIVAGAVTQATVRAAAIADVSAVTIRLVGWVAWILQRSRSYRTAR